MSPNPSSKCLADGNTRSATPRTISLKPLLGLNLSAVKLYAMRLAGATGKPQR
jgi:hypothetical protein